MAASVAALAIAVCGCSAAQAGRDSNSGVKAELAAIREELQAGRDVNNGLSSRGITVIAVAGIAAIVAYRWDRDRSNRKITSQVVSSRRIGVTDLPE